MLQTNLEKCTVAQYGVFKVRWPRNFIRFLVMVNTFKKRWFSVLGIQILKYLIYFRVQQKLVNPRDMGSYLTNRVKQKRSYLEKDIKGIPFMQMP
jgi:hypothetical protein